MAMMSGFWAWLAGDDTVLDTDAPRYYRGQVSRITGMIVVLGLFSTCVYAVGMSSTVAQGLIIVSVGILVSVASLLVGSLLGLIFAVPRFRRSYGDGALRRQGNLERNTNLEDISDWLTKIIVGLGLIQLGSIPTYLLGIADFLSPGLTGTPVGLGPDYVELTRRIGRVAAISLMVYFVALGFVASFLWCQALLPLIFGQYGDADRARVADDFPQQGSVGLAAIDGEAGTTPDDQFARGPTDVGAARVGGT